MKIIKPKHEFGEQEKKELITAWMMLSLAFAILLNDGNLFDQGIFFSFIVSALTVGLGFLLHEIGHKIVAQRYNCWAEFRADRFMLFIAIIMSFFGFILAAPGAVFIKGTITVKRNGIISMIGPLINLLLGLIFLGLKFLVAKDTIWADVAYYGVFINAWLGVFNMIPFLGMDGQKIWKWNKLVYFSMLIAGAGLFFGAYYL